MIVKQNWYHIYLIEQNSIEQNASFTSNLISLLLTLSMLGFEAKCVEHVAKNNGISKESIAQNMKDPSTVKTLQKIVKEKETNPVAKKVYQKAKEDALKTKRDIAQHEVKNNSKTVKQPQPVQKNFPLATVNDKVVSSVKAVEGSGSLDISSAGASGVMQVMEPAWEEINKEVYGGKYPYSKFKRDDKINTMMGKTYLEKLAKRLNKHHEIWKNKSNPYILLLAAYNSGFAHVEKCGFDEEVIKKKMPGVYDYALRGTNLINADENSFLPPQK